MSSILNHLVAVPKNFMTSPTLLLDVSLRHNSFGNQSIVFRKEQPFYPLSSRLGITYKGALAEIGTVAQTRSKFQTDTLIESRIATNLQQYKDRFQILNPYSLRNHLPEQFPNIITTTLVNPRGRTLNTEHRFYFTLSTGTYFEATFVRKGFPYIFVMKLKLSRHQRPIQHIDVSARLSGVIKELTIKDNRLVLKLEDDWVFAPFGGTTSDYINTLAYILQDANINEPTMLEGSIDTSRFRNINLKR